MFYVNHGEPVFCIAVDLYYSKPAHPLLTETIPKNSHSSPFMGKQDQKMEIRPKSPFKPAGTYDCNGALQK